MRLTRARHALPAIALGAVLTLAAACGYDATPVPEAAPTPEAAAPSPPAEQTCEDFLQSYAPEGPLPGPNNLPADSTMAEIRERGRLVAGVSADTFLLSSRNPFTGAIEGFDNDMVRQVARAIFGPGGEDRIQLRVINAGQRLEVLENDEVDIVVRNMTMNCVRWESIAFSAQYYESGQKTLVRSDEAAEISGLADLAGRRVCAPIGSTSLDNLRRLAPEAVAVTATNHSGCLLLFQQGEVDAITGDDTVLAGLAAQDPYAVVLDEEPFTSEPYGIGVNAEDVDLVRFINGVLERMRADGSWQASYDRWLAPTLGQSPVGQPTAQYGRTP